MWCALSKMPNLINGVQLGTLAINTLARLDCRMQLLLQALHRLAMLRTQFFQLTLYVYAKLIHLSTHVNMQSYTRSPYRVHLHSAVLDKRIHFRLQFRAEHAFARQLCLVPVGQMLRRSQLQTKTTLFLLHAMYIGAGTRVCARQPA
jgi:hypothetical protein